MSNRVLIYCIIINVQVDLCHTFLHFPSYDMILDAQDLIEIVDGVFVNTPGTIAFLHNNEWLIKSHP